MGRLGTAASTTGIWKFSMANKKMENNRMDNAPLTPRIRPTYKSS